MKLIKNGTIINEGRSFVGDLLLDGEFIKEIYEGQAPRGNYDESSMPLGCFVLPGVIDDHVHFREPDYAEGWQHRERKPCSCLWRCDQLFRDA